MACLRGRVPAQPLPILGASGCDGVRTVLVNLGKLLTGPGSGELLHPRLTVSALTVQVNLGKLLTGLGSGELLHPQNSVLGATVSRAALYDSVPVSYTHLTLPTILLV